eukprot:2104617-Amphidinium_carterae.1
MADNYDTSMCSSLSHKHRKRPASNTYRLVCCSFRKISHQQQPFLHKQAPKDHLRPLRCPPPVIPRREEWHGASRPARPNECSMQTGVLPRAMQWQMSEGCTMRRSLRTRAFP